MEKTEIRKMRKYGKKRKARQYRLLARCSDVYMYKVLVIFFAIETVLVGRICTFCIDFVMI